MIKNFSILHGKQKSKPNLYIISQKKELTGCGFSLVNQPVQLRTHITDFHVQNTLFQIK